MDNETTPEALNDIFQGEFDLTKEQPVLPEELKTIPERLEEMGHYIWMDAVSTDKHARIYIDINIRNNRTGEVRTVRKGIHAPEGDDLLPCINFYSEGSYCLDANRGRDWCIAGQEKHEFGKNPWDEDENDPERKNWFDIQIVNPQMEHIFYKEYGFTVYTAEYQGGFEAMKEQDLDTFFDNPEDVMKIQLLKPGEYIQLFYDWEDTNHPENAVLIKRDIN